jgi:hypothetical protein
VLATSDFVSASVDLLLLLVVNQLPSTDVLPSSASQRYPCQHRRCCHRCCLIFAIVVVPAAHQCHYLDKLAEAVIAINGRRQSL